MTDISTEQTEETLKQPVDNFEGESGTLAGTLPNEESEAALPPSATEKLPVTPGTIRPVMPGTVRKPVNLPKRQSKSAKKGDDEYIESSTESDDESLESEYEEENDVDEEEDEEWDEDEDYATGRKRPSMRPAPVPMPHIPGFKPVIVTGADGRPTPVLLPQNFNLPPGMLAQQQSQQAILAYQNLLSQKIAEVRKAQMAGLGRPPSQMGNRPPMRPPMQQMGSFSMNPQQMHPQQMHPQQMSPQQIMNPQQMMNPHNQQKMMFQQGQQFPVRPVNPEMIAHYQRMQEMQAQNPQMMIRPPQSGVLAPQNRPGIPTTIRIPSRPPSSSNPVSPSSSDAPSTPQQILQQQVQNPPPSSTNNPMMRPMHPGPGPNLTFSSLLNAPMMPQQQPQFISAQSNGTNPAANLKVNLKNFLNNRMTRPPSGIPQLQMQMPSIAPSISQMAYKKKAENVEEEMEDSEVLTITQSRSKRARKPVKYSVEEEEEIMDEEPASKVAKEVEETEEFYDGIGVEKILSFRVFEGMEEFLVKYKNKSYIHIEWIPKEDMLNEPQGKTRVKRFMSKPLSAHHFSQEDIINPDFIRIDRILDDWNGTNESGEATHMFLVKWCSLPYEESAWEIREELELCENGVEMIQSYLEKKSPVQRRSPQVGVRPSKRDWITFEESPSYKNNNSLRKYQLEGLNWLLFCWYNRQSCIIADEMGLGKTVQSVTFLDQLQSRYKIHGPFMVVAPLSTIPHWEREFAAWTDLITLTYHGSSIGRNIMYEHEFFYKDANGHPIPNVYKFDVLITTYEMAIAGAEHFKDIIWRVGVFDEAHRLKNKASKAAETLKNFKIEHKVLATGTPLQNSLEELYALLNFIDPIAFYNERVFLSEYGNLSNSDDVTKLQDLLKPLMLRRLKEDVEKSIPMKEETIIEVELTTIQKGFYRAILEKNLGFLKKGTKSSNMPNLINAMMELRKCCIHPYLIKGAEERIQREAGAETPDQLFKVLVESSGKLVLVDKLLKKLKENGHKVLIFSQMTRCLDLLSDFLRFRNYKFERIDGAIRGDLRQASIDRFCNEPDSFVFLLCTRAGGVGINLTAADTVVIFDSDWNPQNDIQAQARCHRIGQTKSVKTYRLITRNTYEREMFDKAGLKLGLDKAVLQKMAPSVDDSTRLQNINKKEVEILLKKGAYGLLMDNDESIKFCAEDIDQILERRTQVVKHDLTNSTSIFSKASFTANNEADIDLDLDDPNFWNLWAKKEKVSVDELDDQGDEDSRVKRQFKRLGSSEEIDEIDVKIENVSFQKCQNDDEIVEWSAAERKLFCQYLMKYGFDQLLAFSSHFPNRNLKDLLACVRMLVKYMADLVEDSKFKEDCEKLLLLKISEIMESLSTAQEDEEAPSTPAKKDKKKGRRKKEKVSAEAEKPEEKEAEKEIVVSDKPQFAKREMPYENASYKQVMEYKSFLKDLSEEEQEYFKHISRKILLRMQLMEFVRKSMQTSGSEISSYQSIEIPIVSASPAKWWSIEEDQCLIFGTYKHGYQSYDEIRQDKELVFHSRSVEEWPSREVLNNRLRKLVFAILRKISSDIKLQKTTFLAKRQRKTVLPHSAHSSPRKSKRGDLEEEEDGQMELDDEEFIEAELEDEDIAGGGLKKKRKRALKGMWTKKEKAEFQKAISLFGIPTNEEAWNDFRIVCGLEKKSLDDFDLYLKEFMQILKISQVSTRAGRRKEGDDEYIEEEDGSDELLPADKARKLSKRLEIFEKFRASMAVKSDDELQTLISDAKKPTGMPKWWVSTEHDFAFLKAAYKYGFRADLIAADSTLPFHWILQESEERTTRRKSGGSQLSSWPSDQALWRRFEYLVSLVSGFPGSEALDDQE